MHKKHNKKHNNPQKTKNIALYLYVKKHKVFSNKMAKKIKTLVGKKIITIFAVIAIAMALVFYFSTFFIGVKNSSSLNNLYINMFKHINSDLIGSIHEASQWDEAVEFISNPNKEWVEINCNALMSDDKKKRLVVFNEKNNIIYPDNFTLPEDLVSGICFNTRNGENVTFYAEIDGEFYYVVAEGVQTSEGEPKDGTFAIFKKIDREFINELGTTFDSEIEFIQPKDRRKAKSNDLTRSLIPLDDIHGTTLVYLQVKRASLFSGHTKKSSVMAIILLLLFVTMVFLIIKTLIKYVKKPLETLAEAAENKKSTQFDSPADTAHEFTKICAALNTANSESKKLKDCELEITNLNNKIKDNESKIEQLTSDNNQKQSYLNILSNTISSGLVTIKNDLDITECNAAAQKMFAFEPSDEPSHFSIYNFIDQSGIDQINSIIEFPVEDANPIETTGHDKNDEPKLFEIRFINHPLKKGEFLLVITDKTPEQKLLKQIEDVKDKCEKEKLSFSSSIVNTTINSLPQSIYYKNKNLEYQYVNQKFAQNVGLKPTDIIGKTDSQLNLTNPADEKVMQNGQTIKHQTTGENATATTITACKDNNGQIAGILSVTEDITLNQKLEFASRAVSQSESYAKTVQSSIMPSVEKLKEIFGDVFVIYRPGREVGGDFCYLNQKDGKIILAVGDCTGHGVAGAFMTTLAITTLNQIISEMDGTAPETILQNLETKISEIIDKEADLKDGMDICITVFDKKLKTAEYAGAHSPLYIVRDGNIVELEPAKCPIGEYTKDIKFNQEKLTVRKGDSIYLCTDGFQNQFGGEKNRKFNKKALKQLFVTNATLTAEEQQVALENAFDDWTAQQNAPQVDDVTILGIKF